MCTTSVGALCSVYVNNPLILLLAGKVVDEQRLLGEDITPADKSCVEIAGLCHDLGHGPRSHLWENFCKLSNSSWYHEKSSLEILDLLIESNWAVCFEVETIFLSNSLDNDIDLEDFGLELPRDLVFIKELINGPIEESQPGYPYKGRGEGWVSPSCVWHLTVWCRTREVLPLRDRQQQTDGCGRGQGGDRVTHCL